MSPSSPFAKPVPGPLFVWVKRISWVELVIFGGLLLFWLLPGFETETMVFGWAHGLGFIERKGWGIAPTPQTGANHAQSAPDSSSTG